MRQVEELKKEVSENIKLMKQRKEANRRYTSISKKKRCIEIFYCVFRIKSK